MCAGTYLPQLRCSHASIVGYRRAPNQGGWQRMKKSSILGEKCGFNINYLTKFVSLLQICLDARTGLLGRVAFGVNRVQTEASLQSPPALFGQHASEAPRVPGPGGRRPQARLGSHCSPRPLSSSGPGAPNREAVSSWSVPRRSPLAGRA
jgi:hypothetical protein